MAIYPLSCWISYKIENDAPLSELEDQSKHPFLRDLLQLAKRQASDFDRTGAPLSRVKDGASRTLSKSVSEVWPSHELKFQIDRHGERLVFMVFTPQGHQIPLTALSDGEQWFLRFYVLLAIAKQKGRQVLWLFDEPGRDLHTSAQIDLKGFFESVSEDTQIIYTSHLAMMIPWHRLERIYAVDNSPTEGTIVHTRFWSDANLESPLKHALSTFLGEDLLCGREHLIVEGVSDVFFLQGWIRYFKRQKPAPDWAKNYDLLKRVLVPVDGIEKIPLYCWFLGRKIKKKINWAVVVDSAEEGEATAKKMTEAGLGTWTKNIKSVAELASPKKPTALEIEGVVRIRDYLELFFEYYAEAFPDCVLPTEAEVLAKKENQPKLTKALEELLIEKNPARRTRANKPISLDKTGIAQLAYKKLTHSDSHGFSKETEAKFAKLLENVEALFLNEPDQLN